MLKKLSYWYLRQENGLKQVDLPDEKSAYARVYKIAVDMKTHRKLDKLDCPKNGCMFCDPLERVLKGEGEKVGESTYHQDIYILPREGEAEDKTSTIL